MNTKNNYYLNDYFDIFKNGISLEKEFMKTDIYEKANHYILEMDLPCIKKENIKITYDNNYLTIKISRNFITKDNIYFRRERFIGSIQRSFYIGRKKESDIKVIYKDSTLTISIPKEEINNKNINDISIN